MKKTEVVIIGGGLAGLSAAIHLSFYGISVLLFEKEVFPRHKVCGEYLSKEILPYLHQLELPLSDLNPVEINEFLFSNRSGKTIKADLPLGGLGISRYALDNFLFEKAKKKGVKILQKAVRSVEFQENQFKLITAEEEEIKADFVLGAYGKRSILDKQLKRDFIQKKSGWLAVKAHYKMDTYPEHLVSLHNFRGGYCGLSKTETGSVNMCYLATYNSFKKYKDTEEYKKKVLYKNRHLNAFFQAATSLFDKELTIAQVSFEKKSLVNKHILMLGDAAGLIHPLCGNGMAMAIHSAKTASENIVRFYNNRGFDRAKVEENYRKEWNLQFNSRLQTGRFLQKILLNENLAGISQKMIHIFPSVLPKIISRTHGKLV